jgi:hypothetical protein
MPRPGGESNREEETGEEAQVFSRRRLHQLSLAVRIAAGIPFVIVGFATFPAYQCSLSFVAGRCYR